jgi:hypothetical protein
LAKRQVAAAYSTGFPHPAPAVWMPSRGQVMWSNPAIIGNVEDEF